MGFKAFLSPLAEENIRYAIEYYTYRASVKVAEYFLTELELTIETIVRNPYFQVYYKDNRGMPMKKFPYIIFFKINEPEQLILIKAIFHTSQSPTKYPK